MFKPLLHYIYIFYFILKFTKCELINENLNSNKPVNNIEKISEIRNEEKLLKNFVPVNGEGQQNMVYYTYNNLDKNVQSQVDNEDSKNNDENKKDENKKDENKRLKRSLEEIFPEFKNYTSQKLLMMNPSPRCKIPQRTIFFQYPSFMESNINGGVSEIEITDKEYFVGAIQQIGLRVNSTSTFKSIKRALEINNIIRLFHKDDPNLYWRNHRSKSVVQSDINKYQRVNHMLMFHEICRKHLLYKNYDIYRKKYPNDYNFMPETFTYDHFDEFKNLFKDYKVSKDNLWLIKPRNAMTGRGIRFLKNIEDVREHDIVTRYIADPLLINDRKFDLRFHVLVTGHDPLKIYLHTNGWAKLSTEKYDLDLDSLDNIYKHVTNMGLNLKNKQSNMTAKDIVLSFAYVKDYLKKKYNMNYSEFEEEVKDLIIKAIITMNHLELEKQKGRNLKSNNIFDLYGIDIMVDSHFKPWLLEINISPHLGEENLSMERKILLSETLVDTFNILGMVPYSHVNGKAYEGEYEIEDPVEEAVQQSICEFTRPLGGFERIFPLNSNIQYYKKFFKVKSPKNKALWEEIKNSKY